MLAVTGLALVARIGVHALLPLAVPVSDMAEYWERALYIWEHGALYPNSWRTPGLPASLALAMLGTGPSLLAVRLVNVVAGALTVALTYAVARRAASRRAAAVAAAVVALYPTFLVYTGLVATESLVNVPLMAALWAISRTSLRSRALLGVACGLATLVRPSAIALLPVALALPLVAPPMPHVKSRPLLIAGAGVTLLAFVLTMAPWWLHSYRLHGRVVPLDTTGGINLLLGNNPLATGSFEFRTFVAVSQQYLPGVDVGTPDGADRAAAVAAEQLRRDPLQFVRTAPAKLGALFGLEGQEHLYLYSIGYFGTATPAALWLWGAAVTAAFPLLLAAALAGLAVRGPMPIVVTAIVAFIGVSIAMHLLSFGVARFHLPFVPMLAVLAIRLEHWRARLVPWRAAVAVIALAGRLGAWRPQLAMHLDALRAVAVPGGSSRHLSSDELR